MYLLSILCSVFVVIMVMLITVGGVEQPILGVVGDKEIYILMGMSALATIIGLVNDLRKDMEYEAELGATDL